LSGPPTRVEKEKEKRKKGGGTRPETLSTSLLRECGKSLLGGGRGEEKKKRRKGEQSALPAITPYRKDKGKVHLARGRREEGGKKKRMSILHDINPVLCRPKIGGRRGKKGRREKESLRVNLPPDDHPKK